MKNKIILLVVSICLLGLIFVGCSKGNENKDDIDVSKDGMKITNEGGSVEISNSLDKSVEIPDDFPSDIIPIYKNGTVFGVSEQQGGYAIVMFSKDDVKKAVDFYKSALKDADILTNYEEEDLFEIMGSIKDYTFNVTVSYSTETDDYNTSITIAAFPGSLPSLDMNNLDTNSLGVSTDEDSSQFEDEEDNSKISDDYEIEDGVEIPKNYSSDEMPIYGGKDSKLCFTMDEDPSGNEVVVLGYVSKYSPEEIFEYYQSRYETATTKDVSGGKEINGFVNGKSFIIVIHENDPTITKTDSSFKSMVSININ